MEPHKSPLHCIPVEMTVFFGRQKDGFVSFVFIGGFKKRSLAGLNGKSFHHALRQTGL
jgi:hypothetical protein